MNSLILTFASVCGWIRTTGTFPYTSLAGRHLKPLGHANIKWAGLDSNQRWPKPADLQSAALAAVRPTRNIGTGVPMTGSFLFFKR